MDKFDRIFQLDAIFRRRKTGISAAELMATLECSRATLHRLLAFLRDHLHAPIVLDTDAGGYRYLQQGSEKYELPGLWFSSAELQALIVLQRLAEDVGAGMLGAQITALSRRLQDLTRHKRLNLAEAEARLLSHVGGASRGCAFRYGAVGHTAEAAPAAALPCTRHG